MAKGRHKRDTDARPKLSLPKLPRPKLPLPHLSGAPFARAPFPRAAIVAAPVALVATAAAVTVGLTAGGSGGSGAVVAAADVGTVTTPSAQAVPSAAVRLQDRGTSVSRSLNRRQAVAARTGETRWTTTALDLWKSPGKSAEQDGVAKAGTKVLATGRQLDGRLEVVVAGQVRWVTAGYLDDHRPKPEPTATPAARAAAPAGPAGISMQPCPDMSVEKGLKPQTIKVYRSVCHAFPQVTEYGGWAARSEHDTGNALDVMVYGDKALGDEVAAWARAHAAELDLYDLIWYDRIWTPVRSSEGWRDYGDHGSATANHMDHVHIGTN
ncbi:hypothetical protein JCM18899A_36310 [Nocardioides sp. AN3]